MSKETINKKEPIRILHVTFAMDRGGMESRLMDLFRHIDRKRVIFDFLENTGRAGAFDEEIKNLGGKIFKSGYSRKNVLKAIKFIKDFFEKHTEYHVVHIHESYLPSFNMIVMYYAKKNRDRKIILHSRNANGPHRILHNLLKEQYSKRADYHFACSNLAAKWMFDKVVVREKKYKVINNAIDVKKFLFDEYIRQEVRNELGIKDEEIVLGHVGRFFEQKNHVFLIKLFQELSKIDSRYRLILVGEGPLKNNIYQMAQDFGLNDKILFLGVRNDMERIYQAFDVFVLPSLYEGLPGVGVEAQAAGLQCFFSNTITKEIKIVPELCDMFLLSEGVDIWCSRITEKRSRLNCRRNTYEDMVLAGFDVNSVVCELMLFYEEACLT